MANGKDSAKGHEHGREPGKSWGKKIRDLDQMSSMGAEELVQAADEMGKYLAGKPDKSTQLKTSQIRKFLDAVRRIKTDATRAESYPYRQMSMFLKPQLAYAAGRNKAVTPLLDMLSPGVDKVSTREDFLTLYKLVESIIAYHKYHGGRD